MHTSSRGVAVLVIGTAATLLFGLFYLVFTVRPAPVRQFVVDTVGSFAPVPTPPPDPWFIAYRSLMPAATSTLALRGVNWRLTVQDGACWVLRQEGKDWLKMTEAVVPTCELAGGSIDGRHLTVGRAEQGVCLDDQACIDERSGAWHLYDDRPRLVREVPPPVPEGYWAAIDPVRNIGLYQGYLRSTRTTSVSTRYWLTDEAGAALWSGGIDTQAVRVFPLRLLSRTDGALLLSYRAQMQDGSWNIRLAQLRPTRLQEGWKLVTVPAGWREKVWRVREWQGGAARSEVVLEVQDGEQTTSTRFRVP